ncbi:MAG TPA: hypothetical protein VGO66_12795 [Solirubrobacterales bacterium]|jgi:hypothetical protein|nr:hypothetical protein [Solirubrobacterales bacterium]
MRGKLLWTLVISLTAAVCVAGLALAEKPTVVRAGNLVLKLNGDVKPAKLPKGKLAPITLFASGNISTVDGSQPPVTKTITIDFDKHGTVNAKGLPVCRSGALQSRDTAAAKRACPTAIVGSGSTKVRVEFPEQAPFTASGPLVLFNGGVKGGVTTMFIHAYVNVPSPTAIVTIVKITKIRQGRYGTRAVATIPKIAGGNGAVTDFNLKVQRKFTYKGKRQSYLLARCVGGRFFAHATTAFTDGTRISGTVIRSCVAQGG